jgi:hypothetical protein
MKWFLSKKLVNTFYDNSHIVRHSNLALQKLSYSFDVMCVMILAYALYKSIYQD